MFLVILDFHEPQDSCNMDTQWLGIASFYKIKQLNEAEIK